MKFDSSEPPQFTKARRGLSFANSNITPPPGLGIVGGWNTLPRDVGPDTPVHAMKRNHLILTCLITSCLPTFGQSPAPREPDSPRKTIRVLAVGNSFAVNATGPLRSIVNDSGNRLILGLATPGGYTLAQHHAAAVKFDADPQDPAGKPYNSARRKVSLKEMLDSEPWNFVTIQQSSPNSFNLETYRPHAQDLAAYIRRHAPNAEVVIHQTWAYRVDSKRLYKPGFNQTEMYQGLTRAYHTIAAEAGIAGIIPVGNAFQLAAESPATRFVPDPDYNYAAHRYPHLPKEKNSLHRGYAWNDAGGNEESGGPPPRTAEPTIRLDAQHASAAGKYLGACVWFEFFFKEDVRDVRYKPDDVAEEFAAALRAIAHRAVTGREKPKIWPTERGVQ